MNRIKHALPLIPTLVIVFLAGAARSQVVVAPAGDHLDDANGGLSFTVGETIVAQHAADSFHLAQGYQQAYLEIVGISDDFPGILIDVYPNPTRDVVLIHCDQKHEAFTMLLLDSQGKLIQTKALTGLQVELDLRALPAGTYFLNVLNDDRQVKTYKIVKTN